MEKNLKNLTINEIIDKIDENQHEKGCQTQFKTINSRDQFKIHNFVSKKIVDAYKNENLNISSYQLKNELINKICSVCFELAWNEPKTCLQCDELFCNRCIKSLKLCPVCSNKEELLVKTKSWYKKCCKFRMNDINETIFIHECSKKTEWGLSDLKKHV